MLPPLETTVKRTEYTENIKQSPFYTYTQRNSSRYQPVLPIRFLFYKME